MIPSFPHMSHRTCNNYSGIDETTQHTYNTKRTVSLCFIIIIFLCALDMSLHHRCVSGHYHNINPIPLYIVSCKEYTLTHISPIPFFFLPVYCQLVIYTCIFFFNERDFAPCRAILYTLRDGAGVPNSHVYLI